MLFSRDFLQYCTKPGGNYTHHTLDIFIGSSSLILIFCGLLGGEIQNNLINNLLRIIVIVYKISGGSNYHPVSRLGGR